MADADEQVESLDRLEQALARIESNIEASQAAARLPVAPPPVPPEVKERLDAVIARLRAELEA